MRFRLPTKLPLFALVLIGFSIQGLSSVQSDNSSPNDPARYTAVVRAVAACRRSVVNIRGRKTVPVESGNKANTKLKQVNGMGTGVVIDSRGYVLTNYHVVEGVKVIEVTTSDRQKTTAKLLAHDPVTDLAILKINTPEPLPAIKIGTSSDLMLAESVTAVGNAYGYEHTVTLGIVSALHRTVQVNDDQIYRNLIQTDTAINPGNSGGPLLNVHGEMIGINVAVRIGAQGIAFAIPVDDAIEIAADLMKQVGGSEFALGFSTRTDHANHHSSLVVDVVSPNSMAAQSGLKPGDRIVSVNGGPTHSRLDFQTAMLDISSSSKLQLNILHGDQPDEIVVDLKRKKTQPSNPVSAKSVSASPVTSSSVAWMPLGLKLVAADESELANRHPNYKRGLRVTHVRPSSPAASEGIVAGDILVAMHGWKTESVENLAYILQRPDVVEQKSFMFYILRNKQPFWGQMRVANLPR